MSIAVIEYPKVDVNGNTATVSRWNAAHHPIKFKIRRQDVDVFYSINSTGGLTVYASSVSGLTVGGSVYVNSGANVGNGVILSIDTGSNSFECTFENASTILQGGGFFNNLSRENYYAVTRILGVDAANQYYILGESINKPSANGEMIVNVQVWLKSLLDYIDTFQYDVTNWKDETLGGRFNIVYAEYWTGHDGEFSAVSGDNLFYFVNAAKQIQDLYGSNMGEFVPFINYATDDVRAKFLSDFERPTYFPGFPFSLDFIYSDSIATYEVYKKEKHVDLNNFTPYTGSVLLDANQRNGVNRMTLEGDYDPEINKLNVWLESTNTVISLPYVLSGYVVAGYVETVTNLPDVVIPEVITAPR